LQVRPAQFGVLGCDGERPTRHDKLNQQHGLPGGIRVASAQLAVEVPTVSGVFIAKFAETQRSQRKLLIRADGPFGDIMRQISGDSTKVR
jgi:hypothetical protein